MPTGHHRGPTWGPALDDFADWLASVEEVLESDDWEDPPAAPLDPPVLTGNPSAEQRIRAADLQLRLGACEDRLRARMSRAAGELHDLQQRRDAARRYAEQSGEVIDRVR